MTDEKEYGSLGRLAPEWDGDGRERNLTADDIYERFFGWVEDVKGIEPWPHQEEAIMDLLAGDHVILNTPTGSGKSLVALGMHFAALCTGRRSYYTAPIKALVSEKFFDLVEVFGRDNVGMLTGDTHINADAPIICCTAEILANQALREGRRADVGCVAMDEFHYYGDSERGWAWQVPLLTLPQTQFLLMSATLGNVDAIADKLSDLNDTPDVDVIADAPRPVPLSYEYTLDPMEKTVELAFRNGETPIYVVHFSQDAALETAQALASTGVSSKEQRQAIAEAIKGVKFTTAFGKILQRLLRTGVGIHHAGMLPRYRRLVEQLAQQGLLPVICGTDTLGVGINVPIHSVVLTALTKFDGTKMRRLRAREFHQIAGRAGRMGFDTEGLVIAEAPEYEIENQKAIAKAGGDPKKLKKVKRKKAPEGFVTWNQSTFDKLIDAAPETLVPHMKITHSMVLNEVTQGGDARRRVDELIDDSAQTPDQKEHLHERADEIFQTLFDTKVIETEERDDGGLDYFLDVDMPDDFALDQPLSPFLLAALELLDPGIAAKVRLCAAPLVEGTLAATVSAAAGADIDRVIRDAMNALDAKCEQLGLPSPSAAKPASAALSPDADARSVAIVVKNPNGIHVRPASRLVSALSGFNADMWLEKNGKCVVPDSLNQIALLQVRCNDTLRLIAKGEQAEDHELKKLEALEKREGKSKLNE